MLKLNEFIKKNGVFFKRGNEVIAITHKNKFIWSERHQRWLAMSLISDRKATIRKLFEDGFEPFNCKHCVRRELEDENVK